MKTYQAVVLWAAVVAAVVPLATQAATVSDFHGAFYCKPVGGSTKGGLDTVIGDKWTDVQGREVTDPGHTVFAWGNKDKSVTWGTATAQPDGTVRFVAPGRKAMSWSTMRAKPIDESDYAPWFTIKEDGGKTYECGYAAG